jgi:probable phosphoglycerate mutase
VPEPTTILLVRHGHTDAVGRFLAGRSPGVHLTSEGQRQAAGLVPRLEGRRIAAIYSSPLERARETAEPLAARLTLEIRACDDAIEVDFGNWTGRTFADLETDARWRAFNTIRSVTAPPGGESIVDVQVRILRAVHDLRLRHAGRTVMLVTHADVIRAAMCHFAGIPIDLCQRLEIRPASVSTVRLWDEWVAIPGIGEGGSAGA